MKKILLHVVDNEQRDLGVRLNLALHLSLHGYKSVIVKGRALSSLIQSSRNCIILGRLSANVPTFKELENIQNSSSEVFYFHDEGAFYNDISYNESLSRLHALSFISHNVIKKVFFWGKHQLAIARSLISSHQSKLLLAGSPRFDLFADKSIHDFHSEYSIASILIATRGGSIYPSSKHAHPLGKRIRTIFSPDFIDKSFLESILFGKWKKSAIDAVCFVDLISEISRRFPDIAITVRPHPSEDPSNYYTAFSDYQNVIVQPEGDIFTFIQSHSLLIGCDCTTGVEAILSGKLYINYRPIESRLHDQYRPRFLDRVGIVLDQKKDVISVISELCQDRSAYIRLLRKYYSDLSFLSDAVANLPHHSIQSLSFSEVIANSLDSHCLTSPEQSTFSRFQFSVYLVLHLVVDFFRTPFLFKSPIFWAISSSQLNLLKQMVSRFNRSSSVCSVQFNKASVIVSPVKH